jgi:hypothetical protein
MKIVANRVGIFHERYIDNDMCARPESLSFIDLLRLDWDLSHVATDKSAL